MIYDKEKLNDKQKVYLYKLSSNGEIVELEGYIKNPKNSSTSSTFFIEIDDEGKVTTRITVSKNEGEVRYNAVWFKESDNELKALSAFKENTSAKLKTYNEKIRKLEKELTVIDCLVTLITLKSIKNKG